MPRMNLEGSSSIVTGGASGIGEASARQLTAAGSRVVIADLQEERGQALAAELNGLFVKCDVTSVENAQEAVAAPRFHHQWQPDRLLLNHGIPEDVARDLEGRGHAVSRQRTRRSCDVEFDFLGCFRASVQAVAVHGKRVQGGSDPSKGGWPAGVY